MKDSRYEGLTHTMASPGLLAIDRIGLPVLRILRRVYRPRIAAALIAALFAVPGNCLHSDAGSKSVPAIPVRHPGGSLSGFLVLHDEAGAILASGELSRTPYRGSLKLRVIFHFRDGSLDDETTIYSQRGGLRLISDHLIQSGSTFPNPCDIMIDVPTQQVRIRATVKDKEVEETKHMDLPPDLANGIFFTLIENLKPSDPTLEVPYLAPEAKPRMVKLAIVSEGEEPFKVVGRSYSANRYNVKVELGGLTGLVAPILGKSPADTRVWVSKTSVPQIVRIDGPLYPEGPVWKIEFASPEWSAGN